MKTLNGLPVYKMTIDENDDDLTGVEFISLVDFPAIMVDWVAMNDSKRLKLYAADQDKQVVTGPAMIPDLPIYRADEKMGEYYVSFDKSEIEKIARKFNKEQRTLGINFQHKENSQVEDSVIIEQWFITDADMDKSKALGFDLPVGTWMVTVHFYDKKFWSEEIKTGNVRGFSIEGFLNLQMNKIKNTAMAKIKMEAEIKTAEGVVLYTPADGFVEGSEVWVVDAEGNQTAAPDGDHILDNGVTITVAEGKITTVVEKPTDEKPVEAPVAQAAENKFALGEDDMKAIEEALASKFAELESRIKALEETNASMKAENTEMKAKFANLPGSTTSVTTKNDEPVKNTRISFEDKVNALRALKNKQK